VDKALAAKTPDALVGATRGGPRPEDDCWISRKVRQAATVAAQDERGGAEKTPSAAAPSLLAIAPQETPSAAAAGLLGTALQVFPPFLVAGLGMVAAGLLLGRVHRWDVFVEVREILILVPALLGLKGNLEMTLASRLSTHANIGHLDGEQGVLISIILGNLMVVECQAVVVGLLAALVAMAMNFLTSGLLLPSHCLLLASSAVAAAGIASVLLATVMIAIVLLSHRCGVNPDNVASPIAGMLGDFCTLSLLAMIADLFWTYRTDLHWLQLLVIIACALLAAMCARLASRNPHTAAVLREGWTPVVLSMLISSCGGLILKHAVHRFTSLAPFAPVMNGAGGNLAAIQASRVSTELHCRCGCPGGGMDEEVGGAAPVCKGSCIKVVDPFSELRRVVFSSLLGGDSHARTARTLVFLMVPGAICFVTLIVAIRSHGDATPEPLFMMIYITAALLQACVLLVVANQLVRFLWRCGLDPDNAAIPYVTALGDVIGSVALTGAFYALQLLGGTPWQLPLLAVRSP